ncbi:MAG: OB-fold domain-containing protein, partial [Candidatus Promineifilaceae bacterium]
MIASLEGTILRIKENSLVIGVGGVGLHVFVPRNVLEDLPGPGRTIFLYTHLIVRETE